MMRQGLVVGWLVQLLLLGLFCKTVFAKTLTVAVAANFAPAMEELAQLFTTTSGIPVRVTVSSTGRLFAQIKNGAPYDLFFSADMERPEKLAAEGRCDSVREYARGAVVLWTRNNTLCEDAATWVELLTLPGVNRIGQANPKLAPYGMVVERALRVAGLHSRVESRLVYGANVGQAFQYGTSGATDVAFIAASLTNTSQGQKGCYLPVDTAELVSQGACLVTNSLQRASAQLFFGFLFSADGSGVLKRYGYTTVAEHP